MKKHLFLILFSLMSVVAISQLTPGTGNLRPAGLPLVGVKGWYKVGFSQSDSGFIYPGYTDTAFRPRYCWTKIVFLRPGIDSTVWTWNCYRWVQDATGNVTTVTWEDIEGNPNTNINLTNYLDSLFNADSTLAYFDIDSIPGVDSCYTIERNDGRIDTVCITSTGSSGGGGDEVDPLSWHLLGNAGTDAGLNFVGTTDEVELRFRTNDTIRFGITDDHAELKTYSNNVNSTPGGGFYVNGGRSNSFNLLTYPGANIAISGGHTGMRALPNITGGYWNISIGDGGMNNTTNAIHQIGIGVEVLKTNTNNTGRNTYVGAYAAQNGTTLYANAGVGDDVMRYVVSGHDDIGMGSYALRGDGNVNMNYNIGIGSYACASCGDNNVAVGFNQGYYANNGAIGNVAVGNVNPSMFGGIMDSAAYNTVMGFAVGYEGITGKFNVLIGREAGASNNFGQRVSGLRNTIVGSMTNGYTQGSDGNIALGAYLSNPGGAGADKTLNIGNVIYGLNMYDSAAYSSTPTLNSKIGIRVKVPLATLHIDSDTANVSGLRFTKLTSASPDETGSAIGVNADGKVVRIAGGGGGADFNFAEDDLTATGNRVHTWGTYTGIINGSTGGNLFAFNNSVGNGIVGTGGGTYGTGVIGNGTFGGQFYGSVYGITAGASGGSYSISAESDNTVGNTVTGGIQISRASDVPGAAGIGTRITFNMYNDAESYVASFANQIVSKLTNATSGSEVAELSFLGVNGASTNTLLTLSGNGQARLNQYGSTGFTGTATKWLAVTSNGTIIQEAPPTGGGTYTADNGLTMTSNNTQLGGLLIKNTEIDHQGYTLNYNGNKAGTMSTWTNTHATGSGFYISTMMTGVSAQSFIGPGLYSSRSEISGGTIGQAGQFVMGTVATTGGEANVLTVERTQSGTPAAGHGAYIDFRLPYYATAGYTVNGQQWGKFGYRGQTFTEIAKRGEFFFKSIHNNTTEVEVMVLKSTGDIVASSIRTYADDAAAAADSTLVTNSFYRVTGSNTLRIK